MLANKPIPCIADLSKQSLYNVNAYIVKRLCNYYVLLKVKILFTFDKGQSWGFTSRSTARVILGQVLRIATCGTRTHRGDSL